MKKVSTKKVFCFLAGLGVVFFITISGCKKDQSKQDEFEQDSYKNGSLSASPDYVKALNGSGIGCWATFGKDASDRTKSPSDSFNKYLDCSGNEKIPDLGVPVHTSPTGYPAPQPTPTVWLEDLFLEVGMNMGDIHDPAKIEVLSVYVKSFIDRINDAAIIVQKEHSGVNIPWLTSAIQKNNVFNKKDSEVATKILTIYFDSIDKKGTPADQSKNPLWKPLGFENLAIFGGISSIGGLDGGSFIIK